MLCESTCIRFLMSENQTHRDRKKSDGFQSLGIVGGMGSYLMGIEFQMKRVMEIDCTTVWMYLTLLNCTLENDQDGKFYVCMLAC